MEKSRLVLAVFILILTFLPAANAFSSSENRLIEKLLHFPVSSQNHMEKQTDSNAPNKEIGRSDLSLLGYWSEQAEDHQANVPSDNVRHLLLHACEKYPKYLPGIINYFQDTKSTLETVNRIYQNELSTNQRHKYWREKVHKWLILHHPDFQAELIQSAENAHDKGGWIAGEEELTSLAKRNWKIAEPILSKFAQQIPSDIATLSLGLLYKRDIHFGNLAKANQRRDILKKIAIDSNASGLSRKMAIEVLMDASWDGKDDWYLSLFKDPTITYITDKYILYQPLSDVVTKKPDYWIPRLAGLVGNKNKTIHNNIVSILILFNLDQARRDALEPLLPWLYDSTWSTARDRLRLVQSLYTLGLSSSIDGLIHILRNESGYIRGYAAAELAKFDVKEAIPLLKMILKKYVDTSERRLLVDSLIKLNGLTDQEKVDAIEAYAKEVVKHIGSKKYIDSDQLNIQPFIGSRLSIVGRLPSHSFADLLAKRLDEIAIQNSKLAMQVEELILHWNSPVIGEYLLNKLANRKATAREIAWLVQTKEIPKGKFNPVLKNMISGKGLPKGIAAVMLADKDLQLDILRSDDLLAKQALLAGARLIHTPLPIELIGSFLNVDQPELVYAASRYLEANDSAPARKLIYAYSKSYRILGARQSFDPGHYTFSEFDKLEDGLQKEIEDPHGPEEIFALLSAGYWGNNGQRIIRIRRGQAHITYSKSNQRSYGAEVARNRFQKLLAFIHNYKVDNLGPLNTSVYDGIQYEYLHLTKNGGRRVFMNNPGQGGSGGTSYDQLVALFFELGNASKLSVHYKVLEEVDGAHLLYDRSDATSIKAVCGDQDVTYILVEKGGELKWHVWRDEMLPSISGEPGPCRIISHLKDVPEDLRNDLQGTPFAWQVQAGRDTIRGTGPLNPGLWRCHSGKAPEKIRDGWYGGIIVTPNGKWAVASRTMPGKSWATPNPIVRINLITNDEFTVNIPAADNFEPVAYIPSYDNVLLVRGSDENSKKSNSDISIQLEFYLLDAETGKTKVVHGNFIPWFHQTYRPLQRTLNKNEVWAAIPDYDGKGTLVGYYNTKKFEFKPLAEYPDITFNSSDMWVEPSEGVVFLAFRGDLLSLPLPHTNLGD